MEQEFRKKLLSRFRKDELIAVIRKWGYISMNSSILRNLSETSDPVGAKINKKALVSDIVKYSITKRISRSAFEELDLIYVHTHSKSKLWSVFEIKRAEGSVHKSYSPDIFRNEIRNQLDSYFTSAVCLLHRENAYWIRICVEDVGVRGSSHVCYVIYHPQADYLIVNGVLKSLSQYVFQAFASVTNGTKLADIQLQGRCVQSLAQLSIGKDHQGPYSRQALNQENGTALTTRPNKRKRQDDDGHGILLQVINENGDERRRTKARLDQTFGPNEMPTLEKVIFQCQTDFAGVEDAPTMAKYRGETFECTVKFEGPSVLEGIRNLAEAGLADLPMRKHLATIQDKARNKFLIQKAPNRKQ